MTIFRDRPELLQAYRQGERHALTEVYWAYVERVERLVRFGLRMSRSPGELRSSSSDVAELMQEIFARAFSERARLGFDGLRDYGPYLGTLARNLIVDWARRRRREVLLGA